MLMSEMKNVPKTNNKHGSWITLVLPDTLPGCQACFVGHL